MPLDRAFLTETLQKLMAAYDAADAAERAAAQEKARIHAAIKATYAMVTDEPLKFTGTLADACRVVLQEANGPLTPVQVRDGVINLQYNLSRHQNPLASIHSVLKRLARSGTVQHVTLKAGEGKSNRSAYKWIERTMAKREKPTTTNRPGNAVFVSGLDAARIAALSDHLQTFADSPTAQAIATLTDSPILRSAQEFVRAAERMTPKLPAAELAIELSKKFEKG